MKNFIYSFLGFCTLIISFYFLMSFIVNPDKKYNNSFMAAMIDKHKRIEQIKEPKIIFAGGSNLAFGINSGEIEKDFSVPVVNLGLHAGLGLSFILNELKSSIKKRDVVFLSIEYYLNSDGDYILKKYTSNIYKEARNYYNFDLKSELIADIENTRTNVKAYASESSNSIKKQKIQLYTREAFNEYGDDTAAWSLIPPKELKDRNLLSYSYWTGIDELNDFYTFAKSKNVEVFFIYPNYPVSEFNKNRNVINKLTNDLSNNLKIRILGIPSDFVYADSLFFDTVYHLNKNGRELRTKKLIEIIKHSNALHGNLL